MTFPRLGIGIGGDYGDPASAKAFMPLKTPLNRLFEKHCSKSYCPNLIGFSLVLRVTGKLMDFESEGIERLRRNRKKQYITVDIVIPEKNWKGVPKEKLRDDLVQLVREALELEVARLKKDKETVDEEMFWRDVNNALAEFQAGAVDS